MPGNHAATPFEGGRPQTPSLPGSNRVEKGDFVTHGDLLRLAQRRQCHGIHSEPVIALCHPEKTFGSSRPRSIKSAKCRGFVGYGDAHPGNVSPLIFNNAEMRMAETRAVNRALRKAYGVAPLLARRTSTLAPFCQSRFPSCATPFSPDRRFRKEEFCTRPERIRHALSHWPALWRAWAEKF